jgi:hypothetical protein
VCLIIRIQGNNKTRIAVEAFETVEEFRCLGTTATHENDIHNEFKTKLISESSCSSHFETSYLSTFFLLLEH